MASSELDELVVYPTQAELAQMAVDRARHARLPNYNFSRALDIDAETRHNFKRAW